MSSLFMLFSGDLLDAWEPPGMHTARPLLKAIQEEGNLVLEVRAKRMLHSAEQRQEGRAMASGTSYLVA